MNSITMASRALEHLRSRSDEAARTSGEPRRPAALAGATLALVALALPGCGAHPDTLQERAASERASRGQPLAELGQAEQAILGGAVDDAHPEVMLLADAAAGFLCTGTTIQAEDGSAFLLTAAHCVTEDLGRAGVVPLDPARFVVVPGTDFAESQLAFPVEAITVEPNYDGGFAEDDIAVVRYFFGNGAAPGTIEPLGADADALGLNDDLTLIGYGQTELAGLNTERRSVARSVDGLDTELVAYSQQDGSGACFGDSGGPGLVEVGGEERVALVISGGVAAAGADCESGIGLAMRVSAYEGFIESVLSGELE